MKTIKVAEATELQLDWLVAYAEGRKCSVVQSSIGLTPFVVLYTDPLGMFTPSTSWAQGGQILERENISVGYQGHSGVPLDSLWYATNRADACGFGQKPLIAVLRCFCSKLGDVVDIPEELCQQQNS